MGTVVVLSLAQKPRLRAYRGLQTRGYMPLTISTARGFGKRTNSPLSKTISLPEILTAQLMERLESDAHEMNEQSR